MKAIILAGGQAKRLRPLTDNTPKCLLKVGGKSIIDYQIENLIDAGVEDIIFVLGFQADKITTHLSENFPDIKFTFIINNVYASTYPSYGLWMAKEYFEDGFLYLNADVICDRSIIKGIINCEHESVTAIQDTPWDEEEVNVIIDNKTSKVNEMGKHISKSLCNGEFIGVTKISDEFSKELKKVLDDFVSREEYKKFAADAINLTIQRGSTMFAYNIGSLQAIEIDTIEDLENAETKVKKINEQDT